MVMVFSEDSNDSVQVLREIERAVHKKIPIILFRISDIEPSEEFEYYVSAVHWFDAMSEPIDQHIESLRNTVVKTFGEMGDTQGDIENTGPGNQEILTTNDADFLPEPVGGEENLIED